MYTYMLCLHLCLVRATVPGITGRCTIKIVHVIRTTISHFDASCVITAIVTAVKTHRPGDLTVCYCGVSTIWPAGIIGTTPSVEIYMMLPFLCRQTSGNGTIQGRDRYHSNSRSHTKAFGFRC